METELTIKNKALKLNGARAITLGEESKNSRTMDLWYETSLKAILARTQWTFATKAVMLSVEDGVSPAWIKNGASIVYIRPSDCIKVFDKYPNNRIVFYEEYINGTLYWLCDTAGAGARYTFYNNNTQHFSPEFTEAFVYKLALNTSYDITGTTTKTEELNNLYEKIYLPIAIGSNAQINTPEEVIVDSWINAKYYDGQQ